MTSAATTEAELRNELEQLGIRYELLLRELEVENGRLREALEHIAREWEGNLGTGQMLSDFAREALNG